MVRTINQTYRDKYQSEKKRKIFKKVFLFLVIFLVVISGMIYGLFFSKLFKIREIAISNNSFIKNEEIRGVIEIYLSENKFFISRFNNIFLANTQKLVSLTAKKFPSVENIKISKEGLHTIKISLDQKQAIGTWCYQEGGQCVYFDYRGIGFEIVSQSSGTLLLSVLDERGGFQQLGQLVAENSTINFIIKVKEELDKINLVGTKFVLPKDGDFRLDVETKEGWKIYLSTKDDLSKQLANLVIFLNKKTTVDQRGQLQYIDLMVPNRVYYR